MADLRRAAGARPPGPGGDLAQVLRRRDHRPPAAGAPGRHAGRAREAVDAGAAIARVHDVREAADFLAVRAVLRGEREMPAFDAER